MLMINMSLIFRFIFKIFETFFLITRVKLFIISNSFNFLYELIAPILKKSTIFSFSIKNKNTFCIHLDLSNSNYNTYNDCKVTKLLSLLWDNRRFRKNVSPLGFEHQP